MSTFTLKIIAMLAMLCDHAGDSILGSFSILNCIGRIAFPIFAFQIAQGYLHTKSLKLYFMRLIEFAFFSQFPFYLFCSSCNFEQGLNIFFTLFLGLLAIWSYDKISNLKFSSKKSISKQTSSILALLVVFGIVSFGGLIKVDYGMYGVFAIFLFYIFRNKKLYMCLSFIALTCIYFFPYISSFATQLVIIFTCLSLVFICSYNGKQGPKCKYLFYCFYPIHLILLSFF